MIKTFGKLTLIALFAAAVAGLPLRAGPAASNGSDPAPKTRAIPFRGKIGAVDKTAKTITLDEKTKRVFEITSDTKLTKDGKPATFDAAVVGDYITGQYIKGDGDKLIAKSIKFGMKPTPKKGASNTTSAPASKNQ